MSETTINWDRLVEMHGQTLAFSTCDEHLIEGLKAIAGKTGRVIPAVAGQRNTRCIDGHAPATWRFYTLGRRF